VRQPQPQAPRLVQERAQRLLLLPVPLPSQRSRDRRTPQCLHRQQRRQQEQ
jgi:hypothetical protein